MHIKGGKKALGKKNLTDLPINIILIFLFAELRGKMRSGYRVAIE